MVRASAAGVFAILIRMRLTIVNQFYAPDLAPTGRLAASLAEHRAALGDEVTVVAGAGGYAGKPAAAPREGDAIRVLRLWTPGLGKRTALRRVLDYAAFFLLAAIRLALLPRQDVIVAMTTPPFILWTALIHKLFHRRTRIVLWNMDSYPEVAERDGVIRPGGVASRILAWLNRWAFSRIEAIVCLDEAMAALLRSRYEPAGQTLPIRVIPNWERAADFPRWPALGELDAQDAALVDGRFVVLYTGNRGRGHGFEAVIEAAQHLRNEPVRFVFVGGGSQTDGLLAAASRGRLENIALVDYVPEDRLRQLMAAADCALITLRDEMLGVMSPSKLHANLAMGLPVLYLGPADSNVDCAIRRCGCGASLHAKDHVGLAASIRQWMRQPERLRELSRRARAGFEEWYCDRRTLPQFDQLLDRSIRPESELPIERRKAA
jgi:glycosyltransferase involved in cell wall biosynthesis